MKKQRKLATCAENQLSSLSILLFTVQICASFLEQLLHSEDEVLQHFLNNAILGDLLDRDSLLH